MLVPNRRPGVSLVTFFRAMLQSHRLRKSERIALIGAALVSLVLRGIAFFHYRFDSDEPQHLHVAWGWTRGMVQYRDYFDNHTPLFHLISAPLLSWLGERPDILIYMRAPMLVFWAAVLGCTYVLGRRLYDARIAVTSTVLLSLFPVFFLKSLEYRNDNLWSALWMIAVAVLTGGPVGAARLVVVGLILGAAAATSLKTIVLVVTLLICAVVTRLFCGGDPSAGRWLASIGAGIAALFVVPLIIYGVFVHLAAWKSMLYCLVTFNDAVTRFHTQTEWTRTIYPVLLAIVIGTAYLISRGRTFDVALRRRFFFGLFFFVFVINIACWWPLVSPRDAIPVLPIAAILGTAVIERPRLRHFTFAGRIVALAFAFVGFTTYYADSFANRTREHITMMRQVLGLTRRGEPLIDYKGETVYRARPYYFILETITREQVGGGFIPDTIERDVIASQCHVAQADGEFWPHHAREFLSRNFLDMGRLRASGQRLKPDGSFTIAIPGEYVVVEYDGEAHGDLDGTPYSGARHLEHGEHRFVHSHGTRDLAVLWAPAWNRGYSPFDLKDRDF
jgi:hypothetical protein